MSGSILLLCSRCYSPHPLIRLLLLLQVDSITIPLGPRLGGLVVDATAPPPPRIRLLLLLLQVDSITIPLGPRLGGLVVDAEGVAKAYGDRLLYDDLSFSVPPGGL